MIRNGELNFRVVKRDGRRLRKITVWHNNTTPAPLAEAQASHAGGD